MNLRFKNSNQVTNHEIVRFRRTKLITAFQKESRSLANVKVQPAICEKKQKTIHQADGILNYQPPNRTQSRGKLMELLSLRKSSLTPLIKQQISRMAPDKKEHDLYYKIRRKSIESPTTQVKVNNQTKSSLASTQKRNPQLHSKSVNNVISSQVLNKSVSSFNCLTPKKNNYFSQREMIKKQRLEGLINLIMNNNIDKMATAFALIKSNTPMLPYIKELERRKDDFQLRRFFIQLVKVR